MTRTIARIISFILALVGTTFVLPMGVALLDGDAKSFLAFLYPLLAILLVAAIGWFGGRKGNRTLGIEDAFSLVAATWIAVGLFGAVPLYLSGCFPDPVDAIFESVSGFTTTGATVIGDVEALPRAVNLWRCQSHWIGGGGVIALTVALLPLLGIGGFRLMKAETTGLDKSKITARVSSTAKKIWLVYFALTVAEAILLGLAGLDPFNALCHAFSTLGTGGFSTRNASIGAFGNPAVEWICTAFMFFASINFALYCVLLKGNWRDVFKDTQLKAFAGIVLLSVCAATAVKCAEAADFALALRSSAFQCLSIISTTGFMTENYTLWRPAGQAVIFLLFMIGGSAGSSAGGIKVIRWVVLAKQLKADVSKMLHRHGVYSLRINGKPLQPEAVTLAAAFVFAYFLLVFLTSFLTALAGYSLETSFTAALSMAGNIGPAFGELHPESTCAGFPGALKLWFSLVMIAGRLELYALIVLCGRLLRPNR